MHALASIIISAIVSTVAFQSYLAICSPSSFGRFAEFPVILLYSLVIITVTFLLIVIPIVLNMKQSNKKMLPSTAIVAGSIFGFIIMLLFTLLSGFGFNLPLLFSGILAGATSIYTYTKLAKLIVSS